MKKFFCVLFATFFLFTFASCGAEGDLASNASSQSDAAAAKSKYAFQVVSKNNFKIQIDQNMAEVLSALGEPLSYFEAPSCAFDGLDKTYTYAGFVITTQPREKADFVNSIRLLDDSVTTVEEAYVGNTADEVTAIYGEATERSDTLLRYTDGNTSLNFVLQDGVVISIEYLSTVQL